jgi:hypothetical protein
VKEKEYGKTHMSVTAYMKRLSDGDTVVGGKWIDCEWQP